MSRQRAPRSITALALLVTTLIAASCGDSGDADPVAGGSSSTTVPSRATVAPTVTTGGGGAIAVAAGAPFPDARCAANRDAGKITYLSGFDFAAAASIVDVVLAEQQGYYDELCLDVEFQPGFSTTNYPIVASNDAQFASGGSFSEVAGYAIANEADLVAVDVEGRSPIDVLILKPGTAESLAELRGATIGVKGKIPPSVAAMLAAAGLVEGTDYETVLIDGFDPLVHITLDGIVGFPGWESNEPGQLERAGIEFDVFDPSDHDIAGSFGVIFTNRQFLDDHPTAAQDFVRATMRGLADAVADPAGAAAAAIELAEANGNPNFLSPEGETFRWTTDAGLIGNGYPDGTGLGVPDADLLAAELDAYAAVGLFGDAGAPEVGPRIDVETIAGVYDDAGAVIWPSS